MFKQKFWLAVFFIFQIFAALAVSIGEFNSKLALALAVVQVLAIAVFAWIDLEQGVYAAILSIPFYLVIPNASFEALSTWRFAFAVLFVIFYWQHLKKQQNKIRFFDWDKNLKYFAILILISILFVAPVTGAAVKKFLFGLNIYLLYVVVANVIKEKIQIQRALRVTLVSLFTIVALGFVQLFSSFTANIYYFWQYWANLIAKAYYGETFANTATYSNSWFAFNNHVPSLRMFSILPDSHAFAVVCMFVIPFALSLMTFVKPKNKTWLWVIIALSDLGLVFSGTRGMWAGVLAPVVLLAYFYYKHYGRKLLRPMFLPIIIFAVAIVLSPLVQMGVNKIFKNQNTDNFLQRAESIYDIGETSNAGRLDIWKFTLKEVAAAHPFFGVGYGNFQNSVTPSQEKAYNLPKQYITAHSLYLDVLAELGLVGLVAFIYYFRKIVSVFFAFFKKHYLYGEDGYVFFVVNAGMAIAWLLAYSVFDGTIMNDRVLMYFFVILALSGSIIALYNRDSNA